MPYLYPFQGVEESEKRSVWNKGRVIAGYDSSIWRFDIYGRVMRYSQHGNTGSHHGWEIDHIKPSSRGGSNDISNLQPLQWENNRQKADNWPVWDCS
ncbi:MAG: HNH endonuclease [Candidatus Marinimicrobia bacterium]|nr:HNH endonuclease [Candidatus Neomarinimicrobiota bacterium]